MTTSPPPLPSLQKTPSPFQDSLLPQVRLLETPKKLPASAGVEWISSAWQIFKGNIGLWIGALLFYLVLIFIPVVGVIAQLLMTFFIAGISYMAHQQATGQEVKFSQLFIGFQKNTGQLFLLILCNFAILILLFIVMFMLVKLLGLADYASTANLARGYIPPSFWLMLLVMMVLSVSYSMALWVAPVLVVLHDVSAVKALKMSLKACLTNWLPFLVFGLMLGALMLLAFIPLGLGLFVFFPLFMLTYYTSYRSMFTSA